MTHQIFDRKLLRLHRDRAAKKFTEHNFLFQEVGHRLVDRLQDIKRHFRLAVELGSHDGVLKKLIGNLKSIEMLFQTDISEKLLRSGTGNFVSDEEFLPLKPLSIDLAISNLSLHWVNDLPGTLTQIRQSLKPDGLFIGSILGGNTLIELRNVLTEAETSLTNFSVPHLSPFAELADAASLLQRAGFSLPVADNDLIKVSYSDAFKLMRDLRGMGENNCLLNRSNKFIRKEILLRAANNYLERYSNDKGEIMASFEIVYLTGWAPAANQPKPLKPGSAHYRLSDALNNQTNSLSSVKGNNGFKNSY